MRTALAAAAVVVAIAGPGLAPAHADDGSDPAVRLPIWNSGGYGYLDDQHRPVTAFEYGHAGEFSEGFACVSVKGKWFFIDPDGKSLGKQRFDGCGDFSGGLAKIVTRAGPAYLNLRGRIAITPTWNKQRAEDAGNFADGLAPVRVGARWGYIDRSGAWIIPPTYGPDVDWRKWKQQQRAAARDPQALIALSASIDLDAADEFSEGRAAVRVGDKWGYVDATGKLVIEPQWTAKPARFAGGLAAVPLGVRAYAYVDLAGKVAIPGPFEAAGRFSDGLAAVRTADGWRYVDAKGAVAITLEAGIVHAGEFHEGLAAVAKKLELRGYVDKTGAWVIAPAYTSAGEFRHGRAPVAKSPTAAWIDRAGEPVWIADDPANRWQDHAPREFK